VKANLSADAALQKRRVAELVTMRKSEPSSSKESSFLDGARLPS
jgi:hypothetical protein